MLRASLGTPYFMTVAIKQKHLLFSLVLWLWLLIGLSSVNATWLLSWGVAVAAVTGLRAARGLGMRDAVLGMVVWMVSAVALVRGFFTPQIDPRKPIASVVVSTSASMESQSPVSRVVL